MYNWYQSKSIKKLLRAIAPFVSTKKTNSIKEIHTNYIDPH
jgi:hypothetical protein